MNDRMKVMKHLAALRHHIAGRDDAPVTITSILPGEEEQPAPGRQQAVIEAARLR